MSTYTSSLGLELITPGSQAGLWGNTTNNTFTLIDQAITGVTPISFASASGSTYTLTDFNGAEDESRSAVLNITGSASGANTVVIPNKQKTYLVRNNTGQDVTFQTPSPTASYAVGAGYSILIFCDGNNNVFTGIASPGVGTLSVNAGGTGATTFTAGFVKSTGGTNALTSSSTVNAATELSGAVPVANGGTGAVSLTSGALLVGNGTGTVASLSGGTAGYVPTWNGSTWVSAAPASAGVTTFNGRNGAVTLSSSDVTTALGYTPSTVALNTTNTWTGQNNYSVASNWSGGGYTTTVGATGIALGSAGNSINGDPTGTQVAIYVGASQRLQMYTSYAQFNYQVNVALAAEGQIHTNYSSGSFGWHIGEEAGHAFVVYADASGTGQYMSYSSSVWQTRSDRRIKTDLEIIPNALEKMDKINGYTGRLIDDSTNSRHPYLIAQEIQEVLPEAVSISPSRDSDGDGTPDDLLGLGYTDVIPLLVQAIKELKAEIDALKAAK